MSRRISTERILVTNDDGIHAPGIAILEAIARELSDDVWVVAPSTEQSGSAHSLTLTEPLRYRALDERHFAVRGTPTDSIMMAVNRIIEGKRPTLLLSGINRGGNLAEDVTYSGTVAAAIEGTLAGVPSIALSQVMRGMSGAGAWDASRAHARRIIEALVAEGWPADAFINVNFPPLEADAVKGARVTEQGRHDLGRLQIEERRDPRGIPYFWFGLGPSSGKPGHDTDLERTREGWVSITPLHLDMTHAETRRALTGNLDLDFR